MKQLDTENADLNITTGEVVLTHTLAATPASQHLKAEIRAGDGAKNIAGGGVYQVRATVAGVEVFRSDVLVVENLYRKIFDVEFFARASEEVILFLFGLAADTDVDVTAYLYTGANVVEVSDDATAADNLEEYLNGTDGAGIILRAEQFKLHCDAPGEGALDCENVSIAGFGQHNDGGLIGQYNLSGASGQVNEGVGFGQTNTSPSVGQINCGETAQWNEGAGATPLALRLTGAADLLDDILADTDALDSRLTAARAARLDADVSSRATPTDVQTTVLPLVTEQRATYAGGTFRVAEDSAVITAMHVEDAEQQDFDFTDFTVIEFHVYDQAGALQFERTLADGEITVVGATSGDLSITFTAADLVTEGSYLYELWGNQDGEEPGLIVSGAFYIENTFGPGAGD